MAATKTQRFVDLLDQVKHLSIREILNLSTWAIHSNKSVDVTPEDTAKLQELHALSERKLKQAIQTRMVQPLDPQTMRALDSWNKDSLVTREQFSNYFASLGIGIRKMVEITIPAQPLEIHAALLALPADATVLSRDFLNGHEISSAQSKIDEVKSIINRQSEGFFTLDEIGVIMSEERDFDPKAFINELRKAEVHGRPLTRNKNRIPERYDGSTSSDPNIVNVNDLNDWLLSIRAGYKFPIAAPSKTSEEQRTTSPNAESVDWNFWQLIPIVELWQAVLLSLSFDPDILNPDSMDFGEQFVNIEGAEKRLRLIEANLPPQIRKYFTLAQLDFEDSYRSKIKLSEFAAWAASVVKWENLPPELAAMAQDSVPSPNKATTASVESKPESEETGLAENNSNPKPGLTRAKILAHQWPLTNRYTLDGFANALSETPNWLKDSKMTPGRPGKNGSATWNPALLAVALIEKNYASKNALDAFFRSSLPNWLDEWNLCKKSL